MRFALVMLLAAFASACTDEADPSDEDAGGTPDRNGTPLTIEVAPDARTFVELATPSVISVDGDGSTSIAWDLAFSGREIFTNSGVSGPGNARGFGPLPAPTFLSDTAPETPVTFEDRAGGAFLDWYDYDDTLLYSRYHVYGVRDGDLFYKVQILGYYGEQAGAPVSGLYQVRYAEVADSGPGATQELTDVNATAGGAAGSGPAACLDLATGEVTELSLADAKQSDAWHLCFHREAVLVNGGEGGPRGVVAVDLHAAETAAETEAEIQARTADSELGRFDGVDFAMLSDASLDWRGDGVVTPFAARWLEAGTSPPAVVDEVWLVVAADGASNYLMAFDALEGDPREGPATLQVRVKSVR